MKKKLDCKIKKLQNSPNSAQSEVSNEAQMEASALEPISEDDSPSVSQSGGDSSSNIQDMDLGVSSSIIISYISYHIIFFLSLFKCFS